MDYVRYPVGPLELRDGLTGEDRSEFIHQIAQAPGRMREAVAGLTEEQLDTPYRAGGWTVRQVVHHVADSHINGFVRFKWAVTEEHPTLKAYDGPRWAELADGQSAPPNLSLDLLDTLHRRWVLFLESLSPSEFRKPITHPDSGEWTVDGLLQLYAWHGRHHVAHVTELRRREGW